MTSLLCNSSSVAHRGVRYPAIAAQPYVTTPRSRTVNDRGVGSGQYFSRDRSIAEAFTNVRCFEFRHTFKERL